MPRQFSMPYESPDLVERYLRYTYPYDVRSRISDIAQEVDKRRIRGIIHYVQSFCFRQMYDRLLREAVRVPVLTLEADRPGMVDGAALTRIEAFAEMLRGGGLGRWNAGS